MYVYKDKLDDVMEDEDSMSGGTAKVVTELTLTHEVGHGVDDLTPGLLAKFIARFGNNNQYRKDVLRPLVDENYTVSDREYFAEAYHAYLAGTAPDAIMKWFTKHLPKK